MIHKLLLTLTLLLLPAIANAWYLNAKSSPSSGQGVVSPVGTLSYPAGANSSEYTVTPAPGYVISRCTLDGATLTPNGNGKYVVPYLPGRTWRYLVAYFAAGTVNITTQINGGGGSIVEDSNESLTNIPLGSNRRLLVLPNQGYAIGSLTAAGAAINDNGDGSKSVVYSNLQSNKSVSAGFSLLPVVSAAAGSDVTANGTGAEFAATLYGTAISNQGAISYAWSGAGLSFGTPGAAITTVFAASPGIYTATLTATSGGTISQDSAIVTVLNRTEYLNALCTGCHSLNTVQVTAQYYASQHSGKTSCQDCHGQAPHAGALPTSASCVNCHADSSGDVVPHPVLIGTNPCLSCHNPHSTAAFAGAPGAHYNNVTSAGYPASYMTSRANCADCHNGGAVNKEIRRQWAASGHAAITGAPWIAEEFKTRSGCVQCHTTSGFIAYSSGKNTAAWGVAADKTKEVLTCVGCHEQIATGVVRTVAPGRPYPEDAYVNRDLGKSNICLSCHSGLNNGTSISKQLAVPADFNNLPFISPHYLAAGGILHGNGGYHFPGPTTYAFYSSNSHRVIGMADRSGTGTGGPCIACHKNSVSGHSFSTASSPLCTNCHGASLSAENLGLKRSAFVNGLSVLNAMLADKGQPFAPSHPYFDNTGWGTDQAGANTMGAAFNYLLLVREPGAYAHNPAYARQLILGSIDYLYNGQVTGSVDSALSHLVAREKISQQEADSLAQYQSAGNCTSCHANSSGSHPAHLNKGFGCAECHNATVAAQTDLVPGNTTHLNGVADLEAGPGRSFGFAASGGTCSSVSCHNNGSATWGGTLGCDGCHGAPPATASHLKHYGGTVAQAGYGATGIAQDLTPDAGAYVMNCGNCHPTDQAKHGNGVLEVELYDPLAPTGSLKALNPGSARYAAGDTLFQDDRGLVYSKGSCSNIYCHSYKSWNTPTGVPAYSSSCTPAVPADLATTTNYKTVTWEAAPLDCAGCHANPPQTSYPGNGGGAGDSHAWLSDDFGSGSIEFLHKNNMYFETGNSEPLACMYCHNDTVREQSSFTRIETASTTYVNMGSVPIGNFSRHVNGVNDVAFEKQIAVPTISYPFGTPWTGQKLSNASYDTATRTCSNVACHLLRTNVKWGTPYKGGVVNDCERCHTGYGGSCPDSAAAVSRQPSISSTAPALAAPGYLYSYAVAASEPGGGALSYSLVTAPEGMTMSPAGLITWTPREDQSGSAPVKIVVASDASSGILIAEQEFTVSVNPPQADITSTPVTTATAWKAYSYQVLATVASGMPAISYALTSFPSGMTINATSGRISWTPTDLQTGGHPVTVTATSGGYLATQSFTLVVNPSPVAITSTPVTTAQTQVAYSYPVSATMSGVSSFSYLLLTRPTGMAINSAGVISWTPTASQAGSYPVTVQVTGGGYSTRQNFTVVSTASPINITSTAVVTAQVGVPYSYAVTATMTGGGTFTYALTARPTTAMTISAAGVISWTPTVSFIGDRSVTVRVTRGSSTASQSYVIAVSGP